MQDNSSNIKTIEDLRKVNVSVPFGGGSLLSFQFDGLNQSCTPEEYCIHNSSDRSTGFRLMRSWLVFKHPYSGLMTNGSLIIISIGFVICYDFTHHLGSTFRQPFEIFSAEFHLLMFLFIGEFMWYPTRQNLSESKPIM